MSANQNSDSYYKIATDTLGSTDGLKNIYVILIVATILTIFVLFCCCFFIINKKYYFDNIYNGWTPKPILSASDLMSSSFPKKTIICVVLRYPELCSNALFQYLL